MVGALVGDKVGKFVGILVRVFVGMLVGFDSVGYLVGISGGHGEAEGVVLGKPICGGHGAEY